MISVGVNKNRQCIVCNILESTPVINAAFSYCTCAIIGALYKIALKRENIDWGPTEPCPL